MTKRKMLAMIIALVMCVSLSACYGREQSSKSSKSSKFGTFIVVEQGGIGDGIYQYIMYDRDTMVMYSYLRSGKSGGPTVMYNADGTLKIYSPNAEAE